VLLSAAVSYVLTSMAGEPFAVVDTLALAIVLAIGVIILGDGLIKEKK